MKSQGCDRLIEEMVSTSSGKDQGGISDCQLDEEFREKYKEFRENEQARIRSIQTAEEAAQTARQKRRKRADADDSR